MATLKEIQEQIKKLGWADTFGTKKEIRYLPEILATDEIVLGITSGLMNGNTWLITITNKRVIFLDKGLLYGLKQLEIPLEKINNIEQSTGLFFGQIGIADGSSTMSIKNLAKQSVKPFVLALNAALAVQKNPSRGTNSIADQIAKLSDLKEKGALSQQEFEEMKAKVLKAA